MFELPADAPLASLFFAYMRDHGVHVWEGRPGFLTLAHSDADLDHICEAFRNSIEEMQVADFLPRGQEALKSGDFSDASAAAAAVLKLPVTTQQVEVWIESQMGREASCAYNQCFVLHLRGPLSTAS